MSPHSLDDVRAKLATETGLAEVITLRANGGPLVSVINAGVLPHPVTGDDCVAFVSRGGAARLRHLGRDPRITLCARRGWEWIAVDGTAELAGPDHDHPGVPADDLPELLRNIFTAAGGTHDDWAEYDRVMAEDRRCAVLITPSHIYANR